MSDAAAKLVLPDLYPTPRWFPQAFDSSGDWVRMLRFDEDDYRAAPFLDQRGIRDGMPYAILANAALAEHTPNDARRDAHWIFHISHVGSTLVSRLLGEMDGVLALREPRILQSLLPISEDERRRRLPVLRALLSRTFATHQRAMVKASSNVSELAPALVGPPSDAGKALFISLAPRRFIAARLAGNLDELRKRGPERLARLAKRIPALDPIGACHDDARLAAMSWAAEACAIEAATQAISPDRWALLDFDAFLADPNGGMETLACHFALPTRRAQIEAIVGGPLMSLYSKNNTRRFDAAQREAGIAVQLAGKAGSIADAMNWLESTGSCSPLLAAALARYA